MSLRFHFGAFSTVSLVHLSSLCIIYVLFISGSLESYKLYYCSLMLPLRNVMCFNLRKHLLVYTFFSPKLSPFVSHSKGLLTEAENESNLDFFYNKLHEIVPRGLGRKSLFNNKVSSLSSRAFYSLPGFTCQVMDRK